LDLYKIQPAWKDCQQPFGNGPMELNYDKREQIKSGLRNIFKSLMHGDFRGYINESLPQSVIEALYVESKYRKISFADFLQNKISDINKLVEPFVILDSGHDKMKLSSMTPSENLIVGKEDVRDLFNKYGNDQELLKNKQKIYDALKISADDSTSDALDASKGLSPERLIQGFTVEGHLEKITLLKLISGFQLDQISVYKSKFQSAFETLPSYESFTDIRLKPGKMHKEIVFLLAEYFSVLEVKEPHFKYAGRTLAKGLKGRENVIKWFVEERDVEKIKQIKKELKGIWNKVSNSEKEGKFLEMKLKLQTKRGKVIDEALLRVIDGNLKTLEHAINFKYFDSIQTEFN